MAECAQAASTPRSQRSVKSGKSDRSEKRKKKKKEQEKRAHDIQVDQGRIFVGGREQQKDRVYNDAVTPVGAAFAKDKKF